MTGPISPNAFAIIIGAMKCGTTSLFSYLAGHPQICASREKEPEFFSEHQTHGADVKNYPDLWAFDPSVHKFALEASTGYTKFPGEPRVAQNIFDFGLRPKFIYIIRNPFDRIASHFNFMQRDETWMAKIDGAHLISASNYFVQLEQYRKLFPIEDILILDFDRLAADPRGVLAKTYRHLGISDSYFPGEFDIKNATQAETKIQKTLKGSRLGAMLDRAPAPLRKIANRLMHRSTSSGKRTLCDAEKEFVRDKLKQDMARLQRVYGFDVGKWGV